MSAPGGSSSHHVAVAKDLALAGVGENDEFVAEIAADRAGLGHHRHRFQSHAGEGAQIGHEHLVVGLARVIDGEIEGIGILHQEFAAAHHAEARPDLVAELPLNVIEDARQLLVGFDPVAEDRGDQLLIGGTVQHLALVAIADAQHLLAVDLIAAALPPDLGRLDGGHEQLERAGAVLLLAHDLLRSCAAPGTQAAARNRCRHSIGGSARPGASAGGRRSRLPWDRRGAAAGNSG